MGHGVVTGLLLLVAGIAGAAGVVASAIAAHYSGGNLATIANFLLFHAPVFLALAALSHGKALPGKLLFVAAGLLIVGLTLFTGDLALRVFVDRMPVRYVAPAGGDWPHPRLVRARVWGCIFILDATKSFEGRLSPRPQFRKQGAPSVAEPPLTRDRHVQKSPA